MEKLRELIRLCRFFKVDMRNYDEANDCLKMWYVPDSIKKRVPKQEDYRSSDYLFCMKTNQVRFSSWYEDHHNGNAHDYQEQFIDLTEEELAAIIKREESGFESQIKKALREIIINEMVDARFQSIMNGTYFG